MKERVTRKEPPKPAYNPMQFVAVKPSVLCQSAQEQLKKAEEVKKVKEVTRKEEFAADWQDVSAVKICILIEACSHVVRFEFWIWDFEKYW